MQPRQRRTVHIPGSNIRHTQYPSGRGDIFIDSTPRGAYIYIDDIPFVNSNNIPILTPARAIGVMEGQHMVQISLDGYYSKRLIIDVIPDRLNIAYAKLKSIYFGETMQPEQLQPEQLQSEQLQPKQQGTVFFDTQPHGAKIYVDGQLLIDPDTEESLKTPEKVLLYEGRRNFTFVLEGHEDISGYVDVYAGSTVNIFRNMEPGKSEEGWGEPEPQIWLYEQPGILRVYSFPDRADIYVNGRYMGKAPIVVTDVPAGVAAVIFKMPGMMDEEKVVDIVGGAWSDVYATMRPILPELSSIEYVQDSYSQYNQLVPLNEVKTMNIGNITINSNPDSAYIYVDGTLMTDDLGNPVTTPVTLSLYTGSRFIEIYKEGYNIDYRIVYVYEGADIRIDSNLFPSPYYMSQIPEYAPETPKIPYYKPAIQSMEECPSATEGIVVITTYPPGATIIMDGKTLVDIDTGNPLMTPVDLAVSMGYHDLRFKLERFFDEFGGIYVIPRYHQYLHKNFNVCGYEC